MSDSQSIQLSIDQAKKMIDAGDAVQRLRENEDFKTVIIDGYLEREAVRLVHAKSDPTQQSKADQRILDADIKAIGSFAVYLQTILAHARMSRDAVENNQEELDRARAEEGEH